MLPKRYKSRCFSISRYYTSIWAVCSKCTYTQRHCVVQKYDTHITTFIPIYSRAYGSYMNVYIYVDRLDYCYAIAGSSACISLIRNTKERRLFDSMQLLVNNAYVYEAHVNELGNCTLSPTERQPYVMAVERTSRSGTRKLNKLGTHIARSRL